jgi:sugar lactone lactonase YvrE
VPSLNHPIVPTDRIEVVWPGKVDHAEGLALSPDGTVWCGGEAGQIYVGRLDGEPRQIAELPGRTLGFCLDAAGNAYCADMDGPGIYRITPVGRVDLVSDSAPDRPAQLPNHPALLPSGTLVYTDSGDWGGSNGRLYAVGPDGTTVVADESACRFPNGLAVSPDGGSLAVVESTLPGVSVLAIGPGGELGECRVLVEMPETVPDGVAYDADGRLLVSCWAPDAVYLLEPDGRLRLLAHDPLRLSLNQPTNIAFVPGTPRLVAANIGERFLSALEHETPGAEIPRPEFPWQPKESGG